MPIAHISTRHNNDLWLSAPFPLAPDLMGDVLEEWQKTKWHTELAVRPGGYLGNISPFAWRSSSNYWLHVDDSGERADLLAAGTSLTQKTPEEMMRELPGATPEQLQAMGSLATVDVETNGVYVANVLPGNRVAAIGGVVLYTSDQELSQLQRLFPGAA